MHKYMCGNRVQKNGVETDARRMELIQSKEFYFTIFLLIPLLPHEPPEPMNAML